MQRELVERALRIFEAEEEGRALRHAGLQLVRVVVGVADEVQGDGLDGQDFTQRR